MELNPVKLTRAYFNEDLVRPPALLHTPQIS
jgi:hypothetical protein